LTWILESGMLLEVVQRVSTLTRRPGCLVTRRGSSPMSERRDATEEVDLLSAYLPMDRRHALAAGQSLPDRADGAVAVTLIRSRITTRGAG
jgi:hypothetical protein